MLKRPLCLWSVVVASYKPRASLSNFLFFYGNWKMAEDLMPRDVRSPEPGWYLAAVCWRPKESELAGWAGLAAWPGWPTEETWTWSAILKQCFWCRCQHLRPCSFVQNEYKLLKMPSESDLAKSEKNSWSETAFSFVDLSVITSLLCQKC